MYFNVLPKYLYLLRNTPNYTGSIFILQLRSHLQFGEFLSNCKSQCKNYKLYYAMSLKFLSGITLSIETDILMIREDFQGNRFH